MSTVLSARPPTALDSFGANGGDRPRQITTCSSWTQLAAMASGKVFLNCAEKCRNMLPGENVPFYYLPAVNVYSSY